MKGFAEYLLEFISSDWGPIVMVSHAFLESFILPLAHELFLIPVCLAKPHLSFVYALMSTTASVLGISVGYAIGKWGGRNFILWFVKPKRFIVARREIHKYDAWAVAVACFTPIPVKVFALVAGAIQLNYKKMVVIAFLSRGLRFFLVSLLIYFYGEQVKHWILEYMGVMMILIFVFIVASVFLWKLVEKYFMRKEFISSDE